MYIRTILSGLPALMMMEWRTCDTTSSSLFSPSTSLSSSDSPEDNKSSTVWFAVCNEAVVADTLLNTKFLRRHRQRQLEDNAAEWETEDHQYRDHAREYEDEQEEHQPWPVMWSCPGVRGLYRRHTHPNTILPPRLNMMTPTIMVSKDKTHTVAAAATAAVSTLPLLSATFVMKWGCSCCWHTNGVLSPHSLPPRRDGSHTLQYHDPYDQFVLLLLLLLPLPFRHNRCYCRFDVTASFCYTCTCNEVRMLLLLRYERCTITPLSSSSSGWIPHTTIPRSVRPIRVVAAAAAAAAVST